MPSAQETRAGTWRCVHSVTSLWPAEGHRQQPDTALGGLCAFEALGSSSFLELAPSGFPLVVCVSKPQGPGSRLFSSQLILMNEIMGM